MKTGLKIGLAIAAVVLVAAAAAFLFLSGSPPSMEAAFEITWRGETVALSSASFADDFSAALAEADLTPFGGGDAVATIASGGNTYKLVREAQGFLVMVGPRSYRIEAETMRLLAEHEGLAPLYTDLFPRPLVISIGETLYHVPPMSGQWEYLGLDGTMHTYRFPEMCPQIIRRATDEDVVVDYLFEGASTAPYVLFGDNFDEQVGSDPEGSFTIENGLSLSLSASPSYDTEQYRGSLSFAISFEIMPDDDTDVDEGPSVHQTEETAPTPAEDDSAATVPSQTTGETAASTTAASTTAPTTSQPASANPDTTYVGELGFEISATATYPGEMLTLRVYGADAGEVTCDTNLRATPKFYSDDAGAIALIPIRLSVDPGSYYLTLLARGESRRWDIAVNSKDFVVQYLTVDDTVAGETIYSQQANAEYNQKVNPLKYISDPQVYWQGSFILPTEGRITTEFGTKRYTNNDPTPDWHAAIDIGAARGAEVKAAHSGRVLFSEYIALTGNTILIEHGIGLKSWYYHMDSLAVSTGDMVTQGQIIGTVGSTGFSTGPHLHFGMSVDEYYVNPWSFID